MSTASDILAEGQVANSETSFYAPSGKELVGGILELRNTNATTQTVSIWLQKASGTSRLLRTIRLPQNYSAEVRQIHLGPSDDLRLSTTTATAVNAVLYGGDKT